MFCGNFSRSMDKKKVTVLAGYREKLEKRVVIGGFYPEGCLFLCSPEEWEKAKERLGKLSLGADTRRDIRMMLSSAVEIEMDEDGGIKIPDNLMKYADLQGEAVLAGCGEYIEIWDKDRWGVECKKMEAEVETVYESFKGNGLKPGKEV